MEISKLLYDIKENKDNFYILMEQFSPLIKKYVKLLYKDEKEDAQAELVAALWEAVCNIVYYDDDGQIVNYLTKALRNRFLELYRASRKYHDNTSEIGEIELNKIVSFDNTYDDLLTLGDLANIRDKLNSRKKVIFDLIFYEGRSDTEVASELGISRQYVHRVKRSMNEIIKQKVLNI